MTRILCTLLLVVCGVATVHAKGTHNANIDMKAYLAVAGEAASYREHHLLSEDEFIRAMQEKDTLVLDARSAKKYQVLHVNGAIPLNFSDITVASLAELFPLKNQRILIYCNNNFLHDEVAFPTKLAHAALNLSTYIALYSYGYRNIWELGPLLDVKTTKIPMESGAK